MFCIRIGNIPIGIEHRYEEVRQLCQDYIVEDEPFFTVSASEEELLQQQNGNAGYPLSYCELLCIYRNICLKLPQYDAFLMHSAVIAVDGAAYGFAAPSGTGKTTHLRLWMELLGDRAQVINGDKPIYRYIDGVLYACGTPWQGKENLGSNQICPVEAICFLEQSPENRIRLLRSEEVSARIFRQVLLPRQQDDFDRFWKLLERLITTTDFYLLQCNRDPEAAQLAYHTMRRK